MKDPTEWIEDLGVYMDDETLSETAEAMEPTLIYSGSKAAASAWAAIAGIVGSTFGGLTASPSIRQSVMIFGAYLVAGFVVLRGLYPLTVRLFGCAVAWLVGLTLVWTAFLGLFAVIGARLDSAFWGYAFSGGFGLLIGLMSGSLAPGFVRRDEFYMLATLSFAPVASLVATYFLRHADAGASIPTSLSAGTLAGALFMVPTCAVLAYLWDEAQGLRQMGLLYLHNDTFAPKAVAYLDRAIALSPTDPELYNLRGIARSKMDQPDRAAADWAKVTELLPKDPEPHLNRGVDFLRQGNLDAAIAALQTALAVAPDHAKAHSNLGIAYERRGDLDLAIEHCGRAIALVPKNSRAHSNRAYAYFRKGDHQRALQDCDRAIAFEPDLAIAHVNRGHALGALGRTDEAEAAFRQALELNPGPDVRDEALRGIEALPAARGDASA